MLFGPTLAAKNGHYFIDCYCAIISDKKNLLKTIECCHFYFILNVLSNFTPLFQLYCQFYYF